MTAPKRVNDLPLMEVSESNIVLLHPHMPNNAFKQVEDTLKGRWIGQGPKVNEFENRFSQKFCGGREAVAVGSGTDALHLAYLLAGIQQGDEVVTPVFTCTATNIPLLYLRAKVVFADIQPNTLNIDPRHVRQLVNNRTKAIVCVHYGGFFAQSVIATRYLGVYNFGLVSLVTAFVGIVNQFVDFRVWELISNYAAASFARKEIAITRAILQLAFLISFVAGAVAAAISVLLARFMTVEAWGQPQLTIYLLLFALSASWAVQVQNMFALLRLADAYRTSPNAVHIQLWTALIAILLLKYLKMLSTYAHWSLSNLNALLRFNLFLYRDLLEWLKHPCESPSYLADDGQLCLLG